MFLEHTEEEAGKEQRRKEFLDGRDGKLRNSYICKKFLKFWRL